MTPKELLLQVKVHILEEPLRFNMGEGLTSPKNAMENMEHVGAPPCGTVGCIAGWCYVLAGGEKLTNHLSWELVCTGAMEALNIPVNKESCNPSWQTVANYLFYDEAWPEDLKAKLALYHPGTIGYAEVAAERIDRFIEEMGW